MRYNVKALSNETLAQVIRNAPEYAEILCCAAGLGGKLQDGVPLGVLVHEAAEVLGVDLSGPADSGLTAEEKASPARQLRGAVAAGRKLCARAYMGRQWMESDGVFRVLAVFAAGARLGVSLRGTSAAVRSHPQGSALPLEELCGDDDVWAVVFNLMDGLLCDAVADILPAEATREDFVRACLTASPFDLICG